MKKKMPFLILGFFMVSCDSVSSNKRIFKPFKTNVVNIDVTVAPTVETPVEIENNYAGLQLKSSNLLRNSIASCLGENRTIIKTDMIKSESAPTGFLEPEKFTAEQDVITNSLLDIDGDLAGTRFSTRADQLSVTYLGAATSIADVVAENCTPTDEKCKCGSLESAKLLMARCLPSINPESEGFVTNAEFFAKSCQENPKKAIASLIASYAFLISR